MAEGQPTAQKEATILGRSEDILKNLVEFQGRLDNRFSRATTAEEKVEVRPQSPNVLDEIQDNLDRANAHLASIVSFISSDVLPKIN